MTNATPAPAEPEAPAAVAPPGAFLRNDLMVVAVATALIVGSIFLYQLLTRPALISDKHEGLHVSRPAAWLPFHPVPRAPQALAMAVEPSDAAAAVEKPPDITNLIAQSPIEPVNRIEIRIEPRPVFRNWRGALSLFRVARYGDTYWTAASGAVDINGREWIRTRFRYAYVAYAGDSPRVATGIEYATLVSERLFVVTFHGNEDSALALSELLAPKLAIDAEGGSTRGQRR